MLYVPNCDQYYTASDAAMLWLRGDKLGSIAARETLENPAIPREKGSVIAGRHWIHRGHAARLL